MGQSTLLLDSLSMWSYQNVSDVIAGSRTYLAHHELERDFTIIIIILLLLQGH